MGSLTYRLTHTARELGPDRNRRAGGREPSRLLTPTTSCLLREDLRKAAGKEGERGAHATGKGTDRSPVGPPARPQQPKGQAGLAARGMSRPSNCS